MENSSSTSPATTSQLVVQNVHNFQNIEQIKWKAPVTKSYLSKQDFKFVDTSCLHPLLLAEKDQQATQNNDNIAARENVSHSSLNEDPLRDNHLNALNVNDDPLDPLSLAVGGSTHKIPTTTITGQINRSIAWRTNQSFLQWQLKSNAILKKYTTNKNIPIISNIQDASIEDEVAPDADLEGGGEPLGAITLEDRLKMRLESLKVKENSTLLTQTEYVKHLEMLNVELSHAWNKSNDRVKSLRIVIRCAKMLGRNPVPQCYPSIFVLVSRVLDTFGQLVSDRIRNRSTVRDDKGKLISKLPRDFLAHDVPEEAKEVCRNWFYKISSIRELIARIYVEAAIISSNHYLTDDEEILLSHFERLSRAIRGIGDPLAAVYARCFLARKAVEMIPQQSKLFINLLGDFFESKVQFDSKAFHTYLNKMEMDYDNYLDLFQPAIEWILEAIGANGTISTFNEVLHIYTSSGISQCFILDSIIRAFDPQIIAPYASLLLNLIFESNGTTPQYKALQSLGEKFAQYPPKGPDQLQVLNAIWVRVAEVESLKEYMTLAEVYIEYVAKSFSQKEVNILLRHIHGRIEPIASDTNEMDILEENMEGVLLNVMENMPDFVQAFNMEYFLPNFDLLKSSSRIRVSKGILLAFSKRQGTISDPVILSSLYDLARSVHDSINELSPMESKDEVCMLLEEFISRVDYGSQLDKQLNFFMDCRRSFAYFDRIKRLLSAKVLTMCMRAYHAVKGNHNRKSTNFAKACIAFCHITIPSIQEPIIRLRLYLQSAEVCIANGLFSQAETFLELVINDFSKLSPTVFSEEANLVISLEEELVDVLSQMASLLLAVPGHPEKGPFVIIQQYLKVIQEFKWGTGSNSRAILLSRVLRLLFSFMNEIPPYVISTDFSNSDLFVVDSKYYNTVGNFINGAIQLILQDLEKMSIDADASSSRNRAAAAVEFVNSVLSYPIIDDTLSSILKKCIEMTLHTSYVEYATITLKDIMKYGSEGVKKVVPSTQLWSL